METYPKVLDETKIGDYPALVKAGGGYVWDDVLEYRVWCHPEKGAEDLEPLALILQKEYIDEPEPGKYIHVKVERLTEWPVKFLSRPKRTENTIPDFLSPNAPSNRLDILRGLVK